MKNFEALLAPVPVAHIGDALALSRAGGMVAFGSDSLDFFSKYPNELGGLPAYIYASATGTGISQSDYFAAGKVAYRAVFREWSMASGRGKCPWPHERPASAASDSAWTLFWRVEGLERMQTPIAFGAIRLYNGSKPTGLGVIMSSPPKRPMLVKSIEI